MNRFLRSWLTFMVLSATALGALADSGSVRVATRPPGLMVFINGRAAGLSPLEFVKLPAAPAIIQVQRSSTLEWNPVVAVETVLVQADQVVEVSLEVPEPVLVRSEGSPIRLRDRAGDVRSTPVWWPRDQLADLSIESADSTFVPLPGSSVLGSVLVLRSPISDERPMVMKGPGALGVRSETWALASGTAMVVSGVLAAVFRDRANVAAARYMDTRDPGALEDVRKYDRLAGASMVGVQVSFAAFVIFLAGTS